MSCRTAGGPGMPTRPPAHQVNPREDAERAGDGSGLSAAFAVSVDTASFENMDEPVASRPYMPGYGTLRAGEGRGLLPWSWARERLARSHDFWLATVGADGAPHLMPVWAVWRDGALWFSSSNGSRKARNLEAEPRCTISTEDPREPVVVRGRARRVTDRDALTAVLESENAKYGTAYGEEMVDPASNSVFAVRPEWVFALDSRDFNGSPTRFVFSPAGHAAS